MKNETILEQYKSSIHKNKPYEEPGFFNHLFFLFLNKVIDYGQRKVHSFNTLYNVGSDFDQTILYNKFKEVFKQKGSFFTKLLKSTWKMYTKAAAILTFSYVAQILLPIAVKLYLEYLRSEKSNLTEGLIYSALLSMLFFVRPYSIQQSLFYNLGNNIRTEAITRMHVVNVIARMPLHSRFGGKKEKGKGEVGLNYGKVSQLMTSDNKSMSSAMFIMFQLWTSPILVTGYMIILMSEVGWLGLIAPVLLVILIFTQVQTNKKLAALDKQRKKVADQRSKRISEMVMGIKLIKFNAWEEIVDERIRKLRQKESALLLRYFIYLGIGMSLGVFFPLVTSLVIFYAYNGLNGKSLTIPQTYSILALFNNLQHPIRFFQVAVTRRITAMVASDRLDTLNSVEGKSPQRDDMELEPGAVELRNLSVSYSNEFQRTVLKRVRNDSVFGADTGRDNLNGGVEGKDEFGITHGITLASINLHFKPSKIYGVVGKVGCGKSSLLLAIMNEMVNVQGSVAKNGRIAYIPQEAFILNDTVRENILFGSEYNPDLYKKTLDLAQLGPDLEVLPGGDMTQIGERGLNLSGGQKQRISIARAIYSQSDIYLIDDSLSALDSHVGRKVMEKVFLGHLTNKTRVMVTHALQYMKDVDEVIVISEGKVAASGIFEEVKNTQSYIEVARAAEIKNTKQKRSLSLKGENMLEDQNLSTKNHHTSRDPTVYIPKRKNENSLRKNSNEFNQPQKEELNRLTYDSNGQKEKSHDSKLEKSQASDIQVSVEEELTSGMNFETKLQELNPQIEMHFNQGLKERESTQRIKDQSGKNKGGNNSILKRKNEDNRIKLSLQDKKRVGKLNRNEEKAEGLVSKNAYSFYIESGSWVFCLLTLTFFTLFLIVKILSDWWVGKWTERSLSIDKDMYPLIYLGFIILLTVLLFLKALFYGFSVTRASYKIFEKVPFNILRRKMEFFDTTPSGVIMNRCTKDLNECDFGIPTYLSNFLEYFFMLLGAFVVLVVVSPYFIPVIAIFSCIGAAHFRRFILTSVEYKRMYKLASSPVLSKVSEIINGIVSIRNYNRVDYMLKDFEEKSQMMTVCAVHDRLTYRWLKVRIEYMVWITVAMALFFITINKEYRLVLVDDPSLQGLLVSNLMICGNLLGRFISGGRRVMTEINSVDRVRQYAEYDDLEAELTQKRTKLTKTNWVPEGRISINNLKCRYREGLDLVINGLSFDAAPGEKVGLVGRTGCGKSTLFLALMRVLEIPEEYQNQSQIKIDGVNIRKLGLHELRKNIQTIPQDPFLLEGTLRENIDPFCDFKDQEIISSLEKVNLITILKKKVIEEDNPNNNEIRECTTPKFSSDLNKQVLDLKVESRGANLSLGERQLICIARSLIKKPKILLMDEATANIDEQSDSTIQKIVEKGMEGTTILTIAHRLNTLRAYDKIVVIDKGDKLEEGTFKELSKTGGFFAKLIQNYKEGRH